MNARTVFPTLAIVLLLSACGNKGPLVMPQQPVPVEQELPPQPSAPATPEQDDAGTAEPPAAGEAAPVDPADPPGAGHG